MEPDLSRLAAEIGGDSAIVDRFVRDYLDLLDERLPDIRRYLRTGASEAATVALLSLESTTAMFGVPEVVAAIAALRARVGQHSTSDLVEEFHAVAAGVATLRQRLVLYQITRAATTAGPPRG